jgi:hypothetical protein
VATWHFNFLTLTLEHNSFVEAMEVDKFLNALWKHGQRMGINEAQDEVSKLADKLRGE